MQIMAPWVPLLNQAIALELETSPFVTFSFATIDLDGSPSVRTVINRGYLFNDKKSNILTFTTDIRMNKFQELQRNPKFEACFWFPKSNQQFRIKGNAKLLTLDNLKDINDSEIIKEFPIISPHKIKNYSSHADLASHFNTTSNIGSISNSCGNSNSNTSNSSNLPEISEWEAELQDKWENLSTKLKSSFRKPQPGEVLTKENRKLIDSISRGVDGSNEIDGIKNFALVLLLPDLVDFVDLSGNKQTRFFYKRYEFDQWDEKEVCP